MCITCAARRLMLLSSMFFAAGAAERTALHMFNSSGRGLRCLAHASVGVWVVAALLRSDLIAT